MSRSKSSVGCIGKCIGFALFVFVICIPIYFIFFDNVDSLVQKFSLQDAFYTSSLVADDTQEEKDKKHAFFEKLTADFIDKFAITP